MNRLYLDSKIMCPECFQIVAIAHGVLNTKVKLVHSLLGYCSRAGEEVVVDLGYVSESVLPIVIGKETGVPYLQISQVSCNKCFMPFDGYKRLQCNLRVKFEHKSMTIVDKTAHLQLAKSGMISARKLVDDLVSGTCNNYAIFPVAKFVVFI